MIKRGSVISFASITLAFLLFSAGLVSERAIAAPPSASRTSASPVADTLIVGYPSSITLHPFIVGTADHGPASGSLLLERIELPAGASTGTREIAAPELVYAEQGDLLVADSLGLESDMKMGEGQVLQTGASYEVRNDGASPATLLRLSMAPVSSDAATPDASPITTSALSAHATALIKGKSTTLPSGPTTLFLADATYKARSDTGIYSTSGPVGIFVETGSLSVSSPSGLKGTLKAGKGVVLPADVAHREINSSSTAATALIFGVISANQSLAQAIVPTPADTSTATPTIASTNTRTPTVTATATIVPTPVAAGTVLYQADATSGGFEKWKPTGAWHVANGMIISDGSSEGWVTAPYSATVSNYAVEVEVQLVHVDDHLYGTVFGISSFDQTVKGVCNVTSGWTVYVGDQEAGRASCSGLFDGNWHTVRIEVSGNRVSTYLDGAKLSSEPDNALLGLNSGAGGIFTANITQYNMRSFKVIATNGGSS